MPSADPSLATDEVSFTTLNNVYEGIYRLDKDNKPAPAGAAEKATVSEDGLVYKVKLREESKWSDGKPVTAARLRLRLATNSGPCHCFRICLHV